MKKLLSLLGVFSLSATSATGVVSCKPKTKANDENTEEQRIKDLETLQKIAIMAKNDLNEQLFKNNIDSNNVSLLTEIYQTVNKDKTSYVLEQVKDVNIISYFNTVLNVVFDNINRKIAHEYSNYYYDSLPLSYDKTDVQYTVNLVDKSNLPSEDSGSAMTFSLVSVDLHMKFKVKFKDYVQDENHFVSFNVTDDLPKLNLITKYLSEVILPIFRSYAEEYANVNLGEKNIFKKLYQEFNIMYGKDYQEVEDIFKNSFKTYVKAKSESEKYKISFNNQNPFLKQTRSAFLPSYDDKKTQKNYSEEFNLISPKKIFSKRFTTKKEKFAVHADFYQTKMNEQYEKFVDQFYDLKWENDLLNLTTFNFNLNYLKVSGLALMGELTDSDGKNLLTNIKISRKLFIQKIQNFINIIAEFYKFFNMCLDDSTLRINTLVYELKDADFRNYSSNIDTKRFVMDFLVNSFKESSIGRKLPDIDLWNIKDTIYRLKMNYKNSLILKHETYVTTRPFISLTWVVDFIFGNNNQNIFFPLTYYNRINGVPFSPFVNENNVN